MSDDPDIAHTEIFTDGSRVDQTGNGGWAAVIIRTASRQRPKATSQEMELRAMIEAVKMAERHAG
jgi:ribonuclease HI